MLPYRWTSTNHQGSGLMCFYMVDAVGLEPTMPGAADLQSAGVTNFPTHPYRRF